MLKKVPSSEELKYYRYIILNWLKQFVRATNNFKDYLLIVYKSFLFLTLSFFCSQKYSFGRRQLLSVWDFFVLHQNFSFVLRLFLSPTDFFLVVKLFLWAWEFFFSSETFYLAVRFFLFQWDFFFYRETFYFAVRLFIFFVRMFLLKIISGRP